MIETFCSCWHLEILSRLPSRRSIPARAEILIGHSTLLTPDPCLAVTYRGPLFVLLLPEVSNLLKNQSASESISIRIGISIFQHQSALTASISISIQYQNCSASTVSTASTISTASASFSIRINQQRNQSASATISFNKHQPASNCLERTKSLKASLIMMILQ